MSNSDLCIRWRECQQAREIEENGQPVTVLGVKLPEHTALIEPPGIALDSRWMARVSVHQREVPTGTSGETLFEHAKALAEAHSTAWLVFLDDWCDRNGFAAFWARVKTGLRDEPAERRQFEDPAVRAFAFLSSGEYPPQPEGDGWYLRLTLRTADELFASTDSDIVAEVDGRRFPLDLMHERRPAAALPEDWRIFEHDDFDAIARRPTSSDRSTNRLRPSPSTTGPRRPWGTSSPRCWRISAPSSIGPVRPSARSRSRSLRVPPTSSARPVARGRGRS